MLCSICKHKQRAELEKIRKYTTVNNCLICEECMLELKRISKIKKKTIEEGLDKYKNLIKSIRLNEIKRTTKDNKKEEVKVKKYKRWISWEKYKNNYQRDLKISIIRG